MVLEKTDLKPFHESVCDVLSVLMDEYIEVIHTPLLYLLYQTRVPENHDEIIALLNECYFSGEWNRAVDRELSHWEAGLTVRRIISKLTAEKDQKVLGDVRDMDVLPGH